MARANGKDRGLFQRNGVWWIRWTCHYGHEHREKGGSKSLARQLYERRKTAARYERFCLNEARARQKRDANSSFDRVVARYLEWAREHRPRSMRYRECAIKKLTESFSGRQLDSITQADVERHQKRRQSEGVRPATINRERSTLSHLFAMAIKWGIAERNPVRDTEHLREHNIAPRPISSGEEQRLFAVLPEHYKQIVTFALNTGLRLGELQAQRWDDVDMVTGTLTVTKPKSGKRETVPLNTTAFALLSELDKKADLVFPSMPTRMSTLFGRYVRRAGLEGVTFHCLRDTFISRLAIHANPATLMALARHRSFATTQRYLKLDDTYLRQAVETLVCGEACDSAGGTTQNGDQIGTRNGTDILGDAQSVDSFTIG
jgi:integrase